MHIIGNRAACRPLSERCCVGRSLPEASFAAVPFARDAWRLAAAGQSARLRHVPALFSIGNGFIGVRGPDEGVGAPRVYLNGVYERVPIAYHEAAHGYDRESVLWLVVVVVLCLVFCVVVVLVGVLVA